MWTRLRHLFSHPSAVFPAAVAPSPAAAPPTATPATGSKRGRGAAAAAGDETGEKKPRKGLYFEFAKKKWENEDTFKLPDGTYWPLVEEGDATGNHGTVICKLCVRHGKNNNFTGDGYQCAAWILFLLAHCTAAKSFWQVLPSVQQTSLSVRHTCPAYRHKPANLMVTSVNHHTAGRASAARWWTTT